ncbi:60S ribosomal protein L3 [Metarhizium acridum CQMa 102]|uniref:Large ribosomal subunit protein mL44 n=1 Tax=Metarhizium acridum (strain CQMa 102) TaxID=655827 RepID=E9EA84_METAQ|nr:60S ribosomal protein L3 [Metarhizium acridum CQMa 102]EFY87222.1 60S ribosomal protein L3 [Metarhizium acridum CQMa 102]
MKRLRVSQWSSKQLLRARSGASSSAAMAIAGRQPFLRSLRCQSSAAIAPENLADDAAAAEHTTRAAPSPPHQRSLESAKLAALHARLALSAKIPLQTLARALITPSADANGSFNNANLAFLGSTIINYHVLEYLVCKWPRLPMAILYEALRAFSGQESLQQVARRWGVEAAAAPGEEVDAGLLQWRADGEQLVNRRWGYVRSEVEKGSSYRRGMSSRVVLDDVFGDALSKPEIAGRQGVDSLQNEAFASFVQAVVGSIYAHCGREAAKSFVTSHILSRHFDPSVLFQFQLPTRELAMLCAREGFESPVARLESETGRLSRTPVYVVGIYSGKEKLGEGAGPSLDIARRKASMNALKAWYLYSPGNKVRVPSDMMEEGAKPWKAPHIDVGEII